MGSIEGEYFLKRGLFLPFELPQLMGPQAAREGLERLGGFPPGMSDAEAVNAEGAICMLDSTLYLKNQLLRDSDWASMAHSLELRTPLVDAALLEAVKGLHTKFSNGRGKSFLANAPLDPLPPSVINRPKSGFAVPMTQWLASAVENSEWGLQTLAIAAGKALDSAVGNGRDGCVPKVNNPKDVHLTAIPEAGPGMARKGCGFAGRTGPAE